MQMDRHLLSTNRRMIRKPIRLETAVIALPAVSSDKAAVSGDGYAREVDQMAPLSAQM